MYVLSIFIVPDMADQYGNTYLNTRIRTIKETSLHFASWGESATSIADKVIDTGKDLIDETKKTTENIQSTVTQKSEQAKEAMDSVERLYDATKEAKKDIQNLTNFSGSIR